MVTPWLRKYEATTNPKRKAAINEAIARQVRKGPATTPRTRPQTEVRVVKGDRTPPGTSDPRPSVPEAQADGRGTLERGFDFLAVAVCEEHRAKASGPLADLLATARSRWSPDQAEAWCQEWGKRQEAYASVSAFEKAMGITRGKLLNQLLRRGLVARKFHKAEGVGQ